jgi:hypothetical protein
MARIPRAVALTDRSGPPEPEQKRGCLGPLVVIALFALVAFNFEVLAVRFFDIANVDTDPLRRGPNKDFYRYVRNEVKDDRLRVLLRSIYTGLINDTLANEHGYGHYMVRLHNVLPYQFPFGYTRRRLTATERREILARMRRDAPETELRSVRRTEETTAEWEPERQEYLLRVRRILGTKALSEISNADFERFFDDHEHWLEEQYWTMPPWTEVSLEDLVNYFAGQNPWKVARQVQHDRNNPIEFRVKERARFAYEELQSCVRDTRACSGD